MRKKATNMKMKKMDGKWMENERERKREREKESDETRS